MKNRLNLYIASSGHSGSTILDVVLNAHSKIIGLGEVHRLSFNPENRHCGCGQLVFNCPFWKIELDKYAKQNNTTLHELFYKFPISINKTKKSFILMQLALVTGYKWLINLLININSPAKKYFSRIKNSLKMYDFLAVDKNIPIILDSTKDPVRMKSLHHYSYENFKIIYLVRNGLAFAASAKRRNKTPILKGAEIWNKSNRNLKLMMKSIPTNNIYFLRYEDLCENPKLKIQEICNFLNISFEEAMLNPKKGDYHSIPGNPWLFNAEEGELKIEKDEKWKTQISNSEIDIFNKIAGNMNASFGY